MKNDAKEHEKLNELMKKADGHPLMKKILEDEAAAILAKRTEAAEKIETLRKERDEIIPELQADLAEKESKYNEAKKALDIAINEFRQAKLALSSKNFQFENSINRQSNMLIETAPEEIDEAIQFVNKKLSFLRSPGRISVNMLGGERNIITEKIKTKSETNRGAVLRALAYCQQAIGRLGIMKLSPALDLEMIEKLKDGIPRIDVFEESTGERALPGSKGVNPRDLLPSASEMDWRRDKLMERAKKLIQKR